MVQFSNLLFAEQCLPKVLQNATFWNSTKKRDTFSYRLFTRKFSSTLQVILPITILRLSSENCNFPACFLSFYTRAWLCIHIFMCTCQSTHLRMLGEVCSGVNTPDGYVHVQVLSPSLPSYAARHISVKQDPDFREGNESFGRNWNVIFCELHMLTPPWNDLVFYLGFDKVMPNILGMEFAAKSNCNKDTSAQFDCKYHLPWCASRFARDKKWFM